MILVGCKIERRPNLRGLEVVTLKIIKSGKQRNFLDLKIEK